MVSMNTIFFIDILTKILNIIARTASLAYNTKNGENSMECYEQTITTEAPNEGLHEIDDPNYFEWWYFDIDSKNGYHVYIEWHSPLFCLKRFYSTLIFNH